MIDNKKIDVKLSDLNSVTREQFDIVTVAGRDSIADQIERDIEEFSVKAYLDKEPRSHLGASEIGDECAAKIWFKFRWMVFEQFSGRMARLFRRGHIEEDKIIEILVGIGFVIQQIDIDGKQVRIAHGNKHFGGSADSSCTLPTRYGEYPPVLLEFKTSNTKLFGPIKNQGVVKAKPVHWTQMCIYGFKLALRFALYVCVNKDDDDINIELLELDWELAQRECEKADYIIQSYVRPPRISETPQFYICRFCAARDLCHHLGAKPLKNCRSCRMLQPLDNGEWLCHHFGAVVPKEYIPNGCDNWNPLEY